MVSYRIIARLDVKGKNLVKPIQFEGLRVIGNPAQFAKRYADEGADELLYLDIVASLYGRNQLESLIEETSASAFVPITVAGGVCSWGDATKLFNAGADKIAINTEAIRKSELVPEIARRCGSQGVVVSIEAKRTAKGWEAYTDCGRNPSGRCAIQWASEAASLGAGELLVTSIDQDGTQRGFDAALYKAIDVDIPVIAAGGYGKPEHLDAILPYTQGVAIGSAFHYGKSSIAQVKAHRKTLGAVIR